MSHLEKALWIQPSHRLRWAIFLSSTTVSCTFAQSFHREAFGLVVTVARQYPSLVSMAFCYSISQLRRLKPAITPGLNIPIINELGLLRRPRYIHRDSGRKLIFQPQPSCSATNIPSLWSLIARLKRHQIAVAPSAMNSGNTQDPGTLGLMECMKGIPVCAGRISVFCDLYRDSSHIRGSKSNYSILNP